jgi:hypothetical protein
LAAIQDDHVFYEAMEEAWQYWQSSTTDKQSRYA